ncbi:MAG: tetratricopeptide repeat protein, partial [Crocosphaera sp.]
MINWLKKLWNWLKSLFNGSSDGTETDETPSKPRLSDAEYENVLFALLAAIKKGRSWGSCQGFLISRKVKPDELAEWMKEKSLQWLDNSDNYEQLGQDLEELGNIASGKLGNIARKVSSELGVRGSELGNFQGNNLQNTESNPTTSETQNITPSQTTTDEVQRLIDQSVEQYQRGEYQEAVNTAVGITQQYPNDDQGWYYLGELMGTFQQYEQAITSYDKALQLKPDYYEAWTNRGVALRNLGRFDEAIASYDKALQLKPDYYEAWVYRGNALDELRRLDEAIASYDKALQLKPDSYEAWYNRGNALLNLGRFDEAIASYDKALQLKRDYHLAWYSRGNALSELGRFDEAIASYDKALQLKRDYHLAWYNRGTILCDKLRRFDEAITSFEKTLEIKPDYDFAWCSKGIALGYLKRFDEAIASYDKALQLKPDAHKPWLGRGIVLLKLGRWDEAIASYDKALQLKPDDDLTWFNRGVALGNLGRWDEAIASFDKALQLKPDSYEAWNNRGIALGKLGRLDEAIGSYDKALQLKPDLHQTWNNRGIASSSSTASEGEILRVESQFIDTFQMELTDASRQLINYFQSLETGDFGDLISFLQQPNSDKLIQFLDQSQLQSISRLNPQLNIRGYEGQLISYRYPLNKHIYQDSHPEGWGYLHHKIGVAQYEHQEYDNAINNYHCALETLTVEQFPELRLGVIQDLVKVYLAVGDKGKADDYLLQGLKLLNQLLDKVPIAEKNQRLRLEAKFLTFRQLTVNVLLEKGEIIEALRNAELEKNRRLTHILEGYKTETQLETESNIYPSYEQIQTLLNHEKAIIYWFNSPMGLITFIIKQNGLITLNPNPSLNPNLEQWIKEWDEDYQDYRSKKDEEIEDKKEHPWRINISDRLEILKEILGISEIEKDLENIEELILIPHQDLHRLPLHYLFNEKDWIISYLPSLQIGLNLKQKQQQLNNSQKESLLSIENPRRDLVFSEIESGIINTYFATIKSSIITIEDFKNAIPNYTHLHFTGHGYYLFDDPERSALEFIDESKKETTQLTAYEISHLNFNSYELITLSACETALNGKQTINSEYVGLVSAFLKSGANCVVSTLWTVDETSSAWLMIYFYQQYRA